VPQLLNGYVLAMLDRNLRRARSPDLVEQIARAAL
jgi:hypothetical protein